LTKQEIDETQIIVTTPEKWDIITRKSDDRWGPLSVDLQAHWLTAILDRMGPHAADVLVQAAVSVVAVTVALLVHVGANGSSSSG
jgi:alpha-L-fucosidase